MLSTELKQAYNQARKDRDTVKKDILGFLLSQLQNKVKALGRELTDEEVIQLIKKEIKTREETIDYLQKQDDQVAVSLEQQKIAILTEYLPKQLSADELHELVEQNIKELEISDLQKQKGQLIGAIMKEYGPQVDGALLNKIITDLPS